MSFEKWIENNPAESVHPQVLWDAAKAEERERCAKIASKYNVHDFSDAQQIAREIRELNKDK